jgi:hypothetical protein
MEPITGTLIIRIQSANSHLTYTRECGSVTCAGSKRCGKLEPWKGERQLIKFLISSLQHKFTHCSFNAENGNINK